MDNITATWHVNVLNGSLQSNPGTFTVAKSADGTAPRITISSPASNGVFYTSSSSITLGGVASDDTGVTAITWTNGASGAIPVASTWASPSIPLSSGANTITVRASDAAGNAGTASITVVYTPNVTPATPQAPVLQDISATLGDYTVGWSAVAGVSSYVLEEDPTGAFLNPIRFSRTSPSISFINKNSGTYFYRVFAVNGAGQSPASGIKGVTVAYNQGPGPILATLPTDDATNQPLNVALAWSASDPGNTGMRFDVYLVNADTDTYFPNNVISHGQTAMSLNAPNLPYNTRVSWGVKTTDDAGNVRYSKMFHFNTITDTTAPAGSLTINNGAATTNTFSVTLFPSASDSQSGAQYMRFSNDGVNWSWWTFLTPQYPWNVADSTYGGKYGQTTYTVYGQFMDNQNNVSPTYSASINKVAGKPGNIILNGVFYQTIQEAINAANAGDTVFLTEGTYNVIPNDSSSRFPGYEVGIVMKPGVKLMGAGASKTAIIQPGITPSLFAIVDADNATIEGLTITNSVTQTTGYGLLMESNSSKAKNCIFKSNYTGILFQRFSSASPASNVQISNCLFVSNTEGIHVQEGTGISILNNTVASNRYGGITCLVSTATITNNIVYGNSWGVAVGHSYPAITFNDVTSNAENYQNVPDQTGNNGNISTDPRFENAPAGDYTLAAGSPAINVGSNVGLPFAGNAPDMGALESNSGGTIQVTSNRANATFTIIGPQATYSGSGLNWSMSNLALGVYAITFAPIANLDSPRYKAVTLSSGQTLSFDGTYSPDTTPPTGTMSIDFDQYATVAPMVTLTFDLIDDVGGLGTGAQMKFSNDGSTWSIPEPYATIRYNWNLTSFGGNASSGIKTVYAMISDALGNWGTITEFILYIPNRHVLEVPNQYASIQTALAAAQPGDIVNVAPGHYVDNLTVPNGVILQGAGSDKTLFYSGSMTVTLGDNTEIRGFGGYAHFLAQSGPVLIENNTFNLGNYGITIAGGYAIIRNNVFDGKYLGVLVSGAAAAITIENNTFVNMRGVAIDINLAGPATKVISRNNIIANNNSGIRDTNTTDTAHQHVFASFNTYWNNTHGDFINNYNQILGPSNINADPLFVNYAGDDFHLRSNSTSINTGDPNPRFNDFDGTRNDRGAFGGPSATPPPIAPAITFQPQDQTVPASSNIALAVVADGTGSLNYQWQKNGVNLSGATGATLTLNGVSALDAGTYSVIVSNSVGSQTSLMANLNVLTPPSVSASPLSQTINSGTNLSLIVIADGSALLNFQWYRGSSGDLSNPVDGATSPSFTTPLLTSTTSYWAKVTNSGGSASSEAATVTVTPPPTYTINLAPYQPPGWSDEIVVARRTGARSSVVTDSSSLTTADSLYVSAAAVNNGTQGTVVRFYMALSVDDVEVTSWHLDPPFQGGYYWAPTDYPIGSLSAGTHRIKIKVDSTNAIGETDESDNEYTKTIAVGIPIPHQPDLWIGTGLADLAGDGNYDYGAIGQTLQSSLARGGTKTYLIKVENDGPETNSFTIKSYGRRPGFIVKFIDREDVTDPEGNITDRITSAFGYRVNNLAPGEYRYLRVRVTALSTAAINALFTYRFDIRYVRDPLIRDAVRLNVRAR